MAIHYGSHRGSRAASGTRVAGAVTMVGTLMTLPPSPPFLLRRMALIAALAGAVGSYAFMLRAGHRNKSLLLLGLFTIWVLSPYAALVLAWMKAERWSALTRRALYVVMPVLSLVSLAVYAVAAVRPPRQAAAVFLLIPAASWLEIAIVPIVAIVYARRSRQQ